MRYQKPTAKPIDNSPNLGKMPASLRPDSHAQVTRHPGEDDKLHTLGGEMHVMGDGL